METDSQGNILLPTGETYNGSYTTKDNFPLTHQDTPLTYQNTSLTLAPPTKKELKEQKKKEKLQRKLKRIEANMIAKMPTNMNIYAVPLIAHQDLILVTENQSPPSRVRDKVNKY